MSTLEKITVFAFLIIFCYTRVLADNYEIEKLDGGYSASWESNCSTPDNVFMKCIDVVCDNYNHNGGILFRIFGTENAKWVGQKVKTFPEDTYEIRNTPVVISLSNGKTITTSNALLFIDDLDLIYSHIEYWYNAGFFICVDSDQSHISGESQVTMARFFSLLRTYNIT